LPGATEVDGEEALEGGEDDFVDAHGAKERVLLDRADDLGPADQEAGLDAAEEFVAGEGCEHGAGTNRLLDSRFGVAKEGEGVDEEAAAEIVHHREVVLAAERDQIAEGNLLGEASLGEIAFVDFQDKPGALRVDIRGVVRDRGNVRGADFPEPGA